MEDEIEFILGNPDRNTYNVQQSALQLLVDVISMIDDTILSKDDEIPNKEADFQKKMLSRMRILQGKKLTEIQTLSKSHNWRCLWISLQGKMQ